MKLIEKLNLDFWCLSTSSIDISSLSFLFLISTPLFLLENDLGFLGKPVKSIIYLKLGF